MHRLLLILPLTACIHTPCPVPMSCVTPDDCVCLVTGAVDERRGGDGPQRVTPDKPDDNGDNGGGSKSSDGNGGDSNGDSNGDNSHE